MLALTHLVRGGLAVGTAVVLATAPATGAQAATGNFRYFNGSGQEFRVVNPPDNVCVALQVRAISMVNETNKSVRVYLGTNCATLATTLPPGRGVSYLGGPQSIRVIG
ncbi:hypothetical protein [Embleya hyalina]|uniref:Secreted protein n=1 Tax=Embleya hyalina TaxID=516124 RepID=A0A401Z569_9ACTN|nr:hypothetical protein [Embleya hyalina]GCE02001.1 hypothetical protein EHYA_09776 [Embleya hyalina]